MTFKKIITIGAVGSMVVLAGCNTNKTAQLTPNQNVAEYDVSRKITTQIPNTNTPNTNTTTDSAIKDITTTGKNDNTTGLNNTTLNTTAKDSVLTNDINSTVKNNTLLGRTDNITPNRKTIQDNISTSMRQFGEVKDTQVVVYGDTAYVGINVNDAQKGMNINELKNKIASNVKTADNNIKKLYVIASKEGYKRMKVIAKSVNKDGDVTTFLDDIRDLVSSVSVINLK